MDLESDGSSNNSHLINSPTDTVRVFIYSRFTIEEKTQRREGVCFKKVQGKTNKQSWGEHTRDAPMNSLQHQPVGYFLD